MIRFIKIIFNAFLLVLAFVGFNAIGGEKYVEQVKIIVGDYIQELNMKTAQKVGDFSNINEEFYIDKTANFMGYKAVMAEHKASGQKMMIIDSGKKSLLTKNDIKSNEIDKKLTKLSEKIKYQGIRVQEVKVVKRGNMKVYDQNVPYAKFEAKVTKLPFSDVSGIVASVTASDGSEKIALSVSEKKKYSQLIADEFYRGVKENK